MLLGSCKAPAQSQSHAPLSPAHPRSSLLQATVPRRPLSPVSGQLLLKRTLMIHPALLSEQNASFSSLFKVEEGLAVLRMGTARRSAPALFPSAPGPQTTQLEAQRLWKLPPRRRRTRRNRLPEYFCCSPAAAPGSPHPNLARVMARRSPRPWPLLSSAPAPCLRPGDHCRVLPRAEKK